MSRRRWIGVLGVGLAGIALVPGPVAASLTATDLETTRPVREADWLRLQLKVLAQELSYPAEANASAAGPTSAMIGWAESAPKPGTAASRITALSCRGRAVAAS